jgi:hypothetical protein
MNKLIKNRQPTVVTPGLQKYRVMQTGSQGHGKTIRAMAAYREAKKAGKTCMIVAKSEQEKMRLVINYRVDPDDIRIANSDANEGQLWN